jgi:hypothetical protein
MTYAAPEPVVSGIPYPVQTVGGSPATSLEDFAGTVTIQIDKHGAPYVIDGEGLVRDDAVRVHEKNGRGGKDLRVWRVYRGPADEFLAETV